MQVEHKYTIRSAETVLIVSGSSQTARACVTRACENRKTGRGRGKPRRAFEVPSMKMNRRQCDRRTQPRSRPDHQLLITAMITAPPPPVCCGQFKLRKLFRRHKLQVPIASDVEVYYESFRRGFT